MCSSRTFTRIEPLLVPAQKSAAPTRAPCAPRRSGTEHTLHNAWSSLFINSVARHCALTNLASSVASLLRTAAASLSSVSRWSMALVTLATSAERWSKRCTGCAASAGCAASVCHAGDSKPWSCSCARSKACSGVGHTVSSDRRPAPGPQQRATTWETRRRSMHAQKRLATCRAARKFCASGVSTRPPIESQVPRRRTNASNPPSLPGSATGAASRVAGVFVWLRSLATMQVTARKATATNAATNGATKGPAPSVLARRRAPCATCVSIAVSPAAALRSWYLRYIKCKI